jgi:hypothetical protein
MATEDWEKYGVSFQPDTAERIESPLEYGDSRSARVRQLVHLGLIVEEVFTGELGHKPQQDDLEGMVRQAMLDYIRGEF